MLAAVEEAIRVSEAKLAENDVMSVNCNVFMYMYDIIMYIVYKTKSVCVHIACLCIHISINDVCLCGTCVH